jgi:small subunit ribosomal protein S16
LILTISLLVKLILDNVGAFFRGMIKIRLKRFGKKRAACYRIVAMSSRTRRDGPPLEELGFYNPIANEIRLDVEGIVRRLQQGAQPTDTVRRILEKNNVFDQLKKA